MIPKTLSLTSISPFLLPQFKIPKSHNPGRVTIICKSVNSQPQQQTQPELSVSGPESQGTGAAAPTRGDIFLERQQLLAASSSSSSSSSLVIEKKKKKKKEKTSGSLKVATFCCYGCGAPLQVSEMDAPGYVDPETYELKKKHRQLRTILCGRCRLLSHGHMVTAVGGNGGYAGGKQFVTAEELREKLRHLRHEKALIVKLVDIVDFNGSFLAHVRDLAGANPIILVVTKVDLLPKGTDFNCVGDWVVEATMRKKLNVLSVHLTSSKSLVGITGVVSEIQKEKKGRDVYILGAANVGKSAFINAILKMLSDKDPVAAMARKYKPIQSAVPGTTVGPIQINAFLGGGKVYDTPGVHLHHRQAAVVHSQDLPALAPRSRLRGQSFTKEVVKDQWVSEKTEFNSLTGFSIFWGGLVRIDVLKVLPETCLTFYGPKAVKLHIVPTNKADDFYKKELGGLLTPPSGEQVEEWAGLETARQLRITFDDTQRPACDVAISGLGWITVETVSQALKEPDADVIPDATVISLDVHVPKAVEIFVRPPLPVGKVGGEWYQYRDLTEKEEETRPKWYF
ncbi:putative nitric-oxide synthase (NADPH) [Helianthus annuus]|uniref:Nitric-oxide synthase (NADPH) n=1 Tax=Helianthus annuus TaxID=4232 RepID=A0A251S385_HELAN|nr:NO-associated protein 1, chloroplastic/mitochondrial [Helianthus annuus]KAF5760072.1 putative nitric-oxide synthase (NADPH) [Helianthus annuus]KAJ0460501.1 putative nitric-oxide synthase (NADPH) [Helianthus annuus]